MPHFTSNKEPPANWTSFKLLVDSHIDRSSDRVVRYNGNIVPGKPNYIPPTVCDPRTRVGNSWKRDEPLELPVPKLRIDENYIGEPPKVEVTMENLNDNVDLNFLHGLVDKFGIISDIEIYFHPVTSRHLGIARIIFEEVTSASQCVENLHGKSVMGKKIKCYSDPFNVMCKKAYEKLTKPSSPLRPPLPPLPPQLKTIENNGMWDNSKSTLIPDTKRIISKNRAESVIYNEPESQMNGYFIKTSETLEGTQTNQGSPKFKWGNSQQNELLSVNTVLSKNDELSGMKDLHLLEEEEFESSSSGGREEPRIDLDTRLRLMQDCKIGNVPSFLFRNSVDEDLDLDQRVPLSRPPSPFLSYEAFLKNEKCRMEDIKQSPPKIEQEMDNHDTDNMSMSSLSSDVPVIVQNQKAALPALSSSMFFQPMPSWTPLVPYRPPPPPSHGTPPWYYGSWPLNVDWRPPMPHQEDNFKPPLPPLPVEPVEEKDKVQKDSVLSVIIETLSVASLELKQVLMKDLERRMCENLAFYLFDQWWKQQELNYKSKSVTTTNISSSGLLSMNLIKCSTIDDITSLFDQQRQKMDSGFNSKSVAHSSFGFGLRGTITKLPSFRKKQKTSRYNQNVKEISAEKALWSKNSLSENVKNNANFADDIVFADTICKPAKLHHDTKPHKKLKKTKMENLQNKLKNYDDGSYCDTQISGIKSSPSSSPIVIVSLANEAPKFRDLTNNDNDVKLNCDLKVMHKSPSDINPLKHSSTSSSSTSSCTSSDSDEENKDVASNDDDDEDDGVSKIKNDIKTSFTNWNNADSSNCDHSYAILPSASSTCSKTEISRDQFNLQFASEHDYARYKKLSPPKKIKIEERSPLRQIQSKVEAVNLKNESRTGKKFAQRSSTEQFELLYKFLTTGLDLEDSLFIKQSHAMMLNAQEDTHQFINTWLNETHWVPHCITELSEQRHTRKHSSARVHLSGSCRTEGFYRMDPREKLRTKYHMQRANSDIFMWQEQKVVSTTDGSVTKAKHQTAQNLSREARSTQRRQLALFGDDSYTSDLLTFNQLKYRKKQLMFGKSSIHDWGLFAMEYIGADEMVIEYVGHVVRALLSDVREKRYERQGIGSSYLFRINQEFVVDATKCGNLARFINHSCDPNCYAKIIVIDGDKKIVIYSKQPIAYGEEITYDYKFPIEDEKIRCLCRSKNCRKFLN